MPKVTYLDTAADKRVRALTSTIESKYGPVLDMKQAAEAIGYSRWTLYALVKDKKIAFIRNGGKGSTIKFSASDLARYVESQRQEARA